MFNKKEKELEDNITHSTVKLLLEKFKFLSLKSKISLVGGISICVITIIFSIVLAFVLPVNGQLLLKLNGLKLLKSLDG